MDQASCSRDASLSGTASEANGNTGESTDGGEEDDLSSSSLAQLDNFRDHWHNELENSSHYGLNASGVLTNRNQILDQTNTEEIAKEMYFLGVQAEHKGHLYDAIRHYRRAVQLVPDIEFRVTELMSKEPSSNNCSSDDDDSTDEENEHEMCEGFADLITRFTRLFNRDGKICHPCFDQQESHLSVLPSEILLYIFKWVISSDLDMMSLERLSLVCRGFYLCARDVELWRLACFKVWGVDCGSPNKYGSWRAMFIMRPRLRFNGAYISKTTYVRAGESTFQDTSYRPWHVVHYYRYLRFFPEGVVLMMTTPEEPISCLWMLRHRNSKYPTMLFGHYRLHGDVVTAVLKRTMAVEPVSQQHSNRYRRQRQVAFHDSGEQTFHLELQLTMHKMRSNFKLAWKRYSSHTVYRNGLESVADFELTRSKFPPLWFSQVRSYTAFSEKPLY